MRTNRRHILSAGIALAGGYFTGLAPAASRLANEQLQIGVIGVGNHGATNLNAVADKAQVVAVCDVDAKYLEPAAQQLPSAKMFRDLRELLQLEALDAVVISTPDHTHAFAAITAMQRGLHVFCEKPLTHTLEELQQVVALAKAKKLVTQTGMQHHVKEGTSRAAALLRAAVLGEIREVHAWTDRPIWPQGIDRPAAKESPPEGFDWDLWLGPARERPYSAAYHPLRWRGWHDFGSGALGDFGPHLLDGLFWGLQLPAPTSVVAKAAARDSETYPAASTIDFTFPETRERPALRLTWYDGGKTPPRAVHGLDRLPPNGVFVVGERGKLFIPDYGRAPKLLGVKEQPKAPPLETPADLHQDWIDACRNGTATCLPFAQAAPLMETCLLGNIALRAGEPIQWDAAKQAISPAKHANLATSDYRRGWQLPQ